ncbi:5-(carboxyamino)imidazole ribonucleotide mutase [candidate division WOR-3 bacterium JGI_Cruoil_03_51_56]|uniref:N5-carboxyaminoimidazole ribonucleotide mutase n=1 Tax=candidate division WOR-3 bacterium JGI_Cruoil_03_51_56 TaxID=1973747 RepID=A0A235BS35_UNCW3|nr:MAG: 5-(carboxyamino)imidazole ribonucleotide mutase [candidate division WOR-3 bacterium JGI_Cruoil_03_51_56]
MVKKRPVIAVVMGSEKDAEVMAEVTKVLDGFRVPYEVSVISAHRTPDLCRCFAKGAARRGIKVIIAGAGKAAHLAGVIASRTILPVIGVPLDAGMNGLDALLSTAQMPAGIPVGTMAVGRSGAVNAALYAVAMLALRDKGLAQSLADYRRRQTARVKSKRRKVVQ